MEYENRRGILTHIITFFSSVVKKKQKPPFFCKNDG